MQTTTLLKNKWQSTLDQISKAISNNTVSIVVNGETIGSQTEAEDVTFYGISYDPKDDLIAVETADLEHNIEAPQEIDLAHEGAKLVSIEIVGEDEVRHLLNFTPALDYPALGSR